MNHQTPPFIAVPLGRFDVAVVRLIDFHLKITHWLENYCFRTDLPIPQRKR